MNKYSCFSQEVGPSWREKKKKKKKKKEQLRNFLILLSFFFFSHSLCLSAVFMKYVRTLFTHS